MSTIIDVTNPPPVQVFPHTYEFLYYQIHLGRKTLRATGHLPDNAFYRYAVALHDFKPKRFDYYHPTLGKLIENWENKPDIPILIPEIPVKPVIPVVPSIPEPSSLSQLAVGLIFLSLMLCFYRKKCHD